MPKIAGAMEEFMEEANKSLVDAHYALVSFRDKPYSYLGDPYEDYCYREETSLESDVTKLSATYEALDGNYGADEPEASLEALIDAMVSRTLGWRSESSKVLILNTDATPHDPNDYIIYNGVYDPSWPIASPVPPPQYMPVYPNDPDNYSSDILCKEYEYPDYAQAANVTQTYGAKVLFILPSDVSSTVVNKWQEINKVLEQPDHYVLQMDVDQPDATVKQLLELLPELLSSSCSTPTPETTAAPVTEAETTAETEEGKTMPATDPVQLTTQEVALETTQEVALETTQEVALETTQEVALETTQEVALETTEPETTEEQQETTPDTTTAECRTTTTTPGECRPTETTACQVATTYECKPQTVPGECEDRPANADHQVIKLILLPSN
ncbi:integrin beta chain [Gregarina niphandrodes]|uniref:Integrin beta chain n=1 Tax=Gregarina niphandrodes TaxID=110365 RepID=A0A023AZ45_GRENI|nr:integrin beta chain [Gregarina niphandrodes]EZG43768.1 integrin beta chain [Gregarina niphandrodes]|eukprot:XP_011134616.1 integrin beta chain [Gregarina niphandrodes]